MTDAQTEARAIALEPLNDLARKKDLFIDNAATASQTDFDEVTREAIELNVIAPLILALSERDTALAAKDAELAAVKEMYAREGAKALYELERAERAEAQLAEARKALGMMLKEHDILSGNFGDVMDPKHKRPDRWPTAAEAARRALEAQGGE